MSYRRIPWLGVRPLTDEELAFHTTDGVTPDKGLGLYYEFRDKKFEIFVALRFPINGGDNI